MKGIWAKGKSNEMNFSVAFLLTLNSQEQFDIKISASSFYKLIVDGKMIAFGPQRAAHGYFRAQNYSAKGKTIVAEVSSLGVKSFCWIKQTPFFTCEIKTADGKTYTQDDFSCYLLSDRLQKVQRYSYQRGFAENYVLDEDRHSLYEGKPRFEKLQTEEAPLPIEQESFVDNAKLLPHSVKTIVERGSVKLDENAKVWRDRAHYSVGKELGGFKIDEWENSATDEASKFVYLPNSDDGEYEYVTFDFGRAITGFSNLKIESPAGGVVYYIFDELLWKELGRGENHVDFARNTCSSVHKWTLKKGGTFNVQTSEPYTVRYAVAVFTKGIKVQTGITDFENPNAGRFFFESSDDELNLIMEAARNTLSQNAVDVLTDCPSRERSGWLSDSWFSSVAERLFTGENTVEKTFLQNYIYAKGEMLPAGILPMNYPADDYEGWFIPNWDLWYVLELYKYYKNYGKDEIVENSLDNVRGVLEYFKKKENEHSLLENLESWIFVEWSSANDASHVSGVNIPSNITYTKVLDCAAELLGDSDLKLKAERIRKYIKQNAFSGLFLVDNLVRDVDNKLVKTENFTEVCQYYAFWFDVLGIDEYKDLFDELINNLGTNRKEGYKPEIGKANVLYGLYMRIDLLMRTGDRKGVLTECRRLFGKMAERTGTLWENNDISASCNHGFASYACKWLIYALTGYDIMREKFLSKGGIGIKCCVKIPKNSGKEYFEINAD